MNWRSEKRRQQRYFDTQSYREEDSYSTGGKRTNMYHEKYSEMCIDNSFVGKVIGKGGSKIKELQNKSNAYIKVFTNEPGSTDSRIRVSGTPDAIKKAKSMIQDLISDDFSLFEKDSYHTGGRRMNMNNEKFSEIFVDSSSVGVIIGKGGSKIRELQDESNAHIQVLKNISDTGETSIMLSGTSEAIERAKSLIEDLIYGISNITVPNDLFCETSSNYTSLCKNEPFGRAELLEKSEESKLMNMENEISSEIFIDNFLVGKVIGKGGYKIRELQDESNAYIQVLKNETDAGETSILLSGTSEAIERAKSLIDDLIYGYPKSPAPNNVIYKSLGDYIPLSENEPFGAVGFLEKNEGARLMNMDNTKSSEIFIDTSSVGKVIGKGGSKIRELQDKSNAHINVLKNYSTADKTAITLSGTSEAIEKAKNLIEELTSNVSNLSIKHTQHLNKQISSNYTGPSEGESFDWGELLEKNEETRLRKLASLSPIIKNFYKEDPEVASMQPEDVKTFRKENYCISVMKFDPYDNRQDPNPVTSFKQAFLNYPELLEELKQQEISSPFPIQSQALPILLQGYDMIGIAQTGTGKTIAFLLPALIHTAGQITPREERVGPSTLILAPTRELAKQIEAEAKKYRYKGITSSCIYGGGNRRNQINAVGKGIDMIIATPGRLNDLCMNGIIDLSGVTYLVIDEADRMLDMGFEPQIRNIICDTREGRQTVMTSATWTESIQELAIRYMTKPFKVNVGAFDLAAVHSVTQEIIFAEDDYYERLKILDEFIKSMWPDDKAIVFVERKAIADDIATDLNLRGTAVQSIHGDKDQYDREKALNDLRTGHVKILIATDVASRGIDIKDITVVFNLFFPRNISEYIHRVGRTGRAGRTGKAISIVTKSDWNHAADLIKILEEAEQYVPDELYDMAAKYKAWNDKKMTKDRAARDRGRSEWSRKSRY